MAYHMAGMGQDIQEVSAVPTQAGIAFTITPLEPVGGGQQQNDYNNQQVDRKPIINHPPPAAKPAPPPAPAKPAGMQHDQYLRLYCRICGRRNIHTNNSLHPVIEYKVTLRTLHDIEVEYESKDIYPKGVCDECDKKYRTNWEPTSLYQRVQKANANSDNDPDAITKLSRENPVADFWAHTSIDCQICDDPNYDKSRAPEMLRMVGAKRTGGGGGGSSSAGGSSGGGGGASRGGGAGAGNFSKNKKYKATVLANVISKLVTESPETIKNLKNFGIHYETPSNPIPPSNFVENDTKRILATLLTQNEKKKVSTLVKAITDDICDGKLNYLREVGLKINMNHPNLTFLLRKIKNFAAQNASKSSSPAKKGGRAPPPRRGGAAANRRSPAGKKGGPPNLKNLPPGLEIRSVSERPGRGSSSGSGGGSVASGGSKRVGELHKVGGKTYKMPKPLIGITPLTERDGVIDLTGEVDLGASSRGRNRKRSALALDASASERQWHKYKLGAKEVENIRMPQIPEHERKRVTPDKLEEIKRLFQGIVPPSRPMKADVLRVILLREPVKRKLLAKVGIKFSPTRGEYIAEDVLDATVVEAAIQCIAKLPDVQWAVIIAEAIFKLLIPGDWYTLIQIGVQFDDTNAKLPLFYRVHCEMNRYIMDSTVETSATLSQHLVAVFNLDFKNDAHVRAVASVFQMGVVKAENFIKSGIGGHAALLDGRVSATSSSSAAGRKRSLPPPPPSKKNKNKKDEKKKRKPPTNRSSPVIVTPSLMKRPKITSDSVENVDIVMDNGDEGDDPLAGGGATDPFAGGDDPIGEDPMAGGDDDNTGDESSATTVDPMAMADIKGNIPIIPVTEMDDRTSKELKDKQNGDDDEESSNADKDSEAQNNEDDTSQNNDDDEAGEDPMGDTSSQNDESQDGEEESANTNGNAAEDDPFAGAVDNSDMLGDASQGSQENGKQNGAAAPDPFEEMVQKQAPSNGTEEAEDDPFAMAVEAAVPASKTAESTTEEAS